MNKSRRSFLVSMACIAGILILCTAMFALFYNGGGAYVIADASPLPMNSLEPSPEPTPTPFKASTLGRLFPFRENGLWGYKNKAGQIVIPANFTAAYEFFDSVAFAASGGQFGLISRTGVWLADPQWTNVLPFSEGKAAVQKDSKWGFIDVNGTLVIDYKFSEAGSFHCGRALIKDITGYGYIDIYGTIAATAKWKVAGSFSDDRAFVSGSSASYVVNKLGEPVFTLPSDETGTVFTEAFAIIRNNADGKCYFMNSNYRQSFPDKYDDALAFSYSLAAVKKSDGLWGFINTKGTFIIEAAYSAVKSFSEDQLAAVCNKDTGLWGYINRSGKLVIPCLYDEAETFSQGFGIIKNASSYFIIDKEGNTVFLY